MLHEQSMVWSSRDDSRLDAIVLITASISVDDENSWNHVEKVNNSGSVSNVSFWIEGNIDITPPYFLQENNI